MLTLLLGCCLLHFWCRTNSLQEIRRMRVKVLFCSVLIRTFHPWWPSALVQQAVTRILRVSLISLITPFISCLSSLNPPTSARQVHFLNTGCLLPTRWLCISVRVLALVSDFFSAWLWNWSHQICAASFISSPSSDFSPLFLSHVCSFNSIRVLELTNGSSCWNWDLVYWKPSITPISPLVLHLFTLCFLSLFSSVIMICV